jgi:L-seryl-tRNA(Ser) seleniumtransferase
MSENQQQLLRQIPSVSDFLQSAAGVRLTQSFGEGLLKLELRAALGELRSGLQSGRRDAIPETEELAALLRSRLEHAVGPEGRRVINATGILLHTGLGRAPLCSDALGSLAGAGRYSLLQNDPETGERSLREEKIERMLIALTGCEAATVVNNNAAATMLILNTLAEGREAIVSRGQLVEIGGAFRLPDVMARSGAIMREVGTTNRTHLRDYESALCEQTGTMVHVHTSNYRVRGFCGAPDVAELCELGKQRGVPVVDDLGSGALVPLSDFGLADEPLVADSIAAGSEAVCFSGDKLICGPQSGIICGRKETVARLRKNPLARMFRVCKLTIAALEDTLAHFLNGTYRQQLPFYQMLCRPLSELDEAAGALAGGLEGLSTVEVVVSEEHAYIGSGSLPDQGIPSRAVALRPMSCSVDELARRLRTGKPGVFGRISEDRLLLDLRTTFPDELDALAGRVREALA